MRACILSIAVAVLAWPLGAAAQQYPDWSGQWTKPPGVGNSFISNRPAGRGQQAPLTPEYQEIFAAASADRAAGGLLADPTGLCLPHGMPRMMIAVYPIEFVVTPKTTYILTDYTTHRRIFTDGRPWPDEILPSFNGYSIGVWKDTDGDGRYDTLEVETRRLRGPRVWDQSGMPMADDTEGVIRERITLDKADGLLHDEMTTIDNLLTRPWTVMKTFKRQGKEWWSEDSCIEGQAHVTIGKEVYFLSGDGTIMPMKNGKPPPDLKYFDVRK